MGMKKENSYNISNIFLRLNQLLWKNPFLQNIRILFYFIDGILLLLCPAVKKSGNSNRKKVLIIYNMALGDGIMFYGVSNCIREIWPKEHYEVSIACQSAFSSLYESCGIYDKVLSFDFSGAVINIKKRMELFRRLRMEEYDFVVDPVGCEYCTTNIFITRASKGKKKIGVMDISLQTRQTPKWLRRKIYDEVIKINQKNLHLIRYYGTFFQKLGAKSCLMKPANLPKVKLPFETPEQFFIVFPTASMEVKKWPPERFAYITRKIYAKTHMPLVVCGTEHDRKGIEEFLSKLSDIEVFDFIGKTNIMQFTELIGRASLVISNDTSAYHIAVARQVKTALICGGYTYHRYAKYNYGDAGAENKNPLLICRKMKCYDCNNHCKYNNFEVFPCIERITGKKAWEAIQSLL